MNLRIVVNVALLAAATALPASAQIAVRGLPSAGGVYAYGGYPSQAPSGRYVPPHVGYPVGLPQANVAYYAPVSNYAPAANYGPMAAPTTSYYAPTTSYHPAAATPTNAYRPTYGSSLIPPTNPSTTIGVPGVSPFVRPQTHYTSPYYSYRPATSSNSVTYYRPVTVYDPVSGVPVTYMSVCTGSECRQQPQRTWGWWQNGYRGSCLGGNCGGSCASGNCGSAGTPYYPTPGAAAPAYPAPATGGTIIPSAQPPLSRTTVPPPATVFPQGGGLSAPITTTPGTTIGPSTIGPGTSSPLPPTNFGAPARAADPASIPPRLGPDGFAPSTGSGTFAPGTGFGGGTTTNYPPSNGTVRNPDPSSAPRSDGATQYYYRGTVREPFSGQPSGGTSSSGGNANNGSSNGGGSSSQPMLPPSPMSGNGNSSGTNSSSTPMDRNSSSSWNNNPTLSRPTLLTQPGFNSAADAPRDTQPSGLGVTTNTVPIAPVKPRETASDAGSSAPVLRWPTSGDARAIPDPEPSRPVNRAPQLLNPRDKTAGKPNTEFGSGEKTWARYSTETPAGANATVKESGAEGWTAAGR